MTCSEEGSASFLDLKWCKIVSRPLSAFHLVRDGMRSGSNTKRYGMDFPPREEISGAVQSETDVCVGMREGKKRERYLWCRGAGCIVCSSFFFSTLEFLSLLPILYFNSIPIEICPPTPLFLPFSRTPAITPLTHRIFVI